MSMVIRMLVVVVLLAESACAAPPVFRVKPAKFTSEAGQTVEAESGELRVPERRGVSGSGTVTLKFVRFKSTSPRPGPPIVYLAGGPGASGIETAKEARFPLFMAMREFGDVIALDQRGAGESRPDLDCDEPFAVPFNQPLERSAIASMIAAEAKCAARLRSSGVDLAGYNTRESAADLEDLRKALGAEKLVLWGTSYGTHLAAAALRSYGATIDRVILSGIEGPDDTWKLPSDQQTLLEEIARRAAADPAIHQRLPDFLGTLTSVLAELEARPKRVALVNPLNDKKIDVVVGKLDLQVLISQLLTGPETFAALPDLVSRLGRGDWTALALLAARQRFGEAPKAMPVAMDCASGASEARRRRIAEEAPRTLLADAINLPFPELCAALNVPDLGDAFRAPLRSDVPALLISGTLDGRTSPHQAAELASGMPNAVQLIIDGAGHSDPLFLSSPKILTAMQEFMRGGKPSQTRIEVTPKAFDRIEDVIEISESTLQKYAGVYTISPKAKRRVVKAGNVLYTIRDGGLPIPMRPTSPTDFFGEGVRTRVHFELDPTGKVVAMVMTQVDGSVHRDPKR
jgi:pimeloyl-ACP methyl ester carboxylesterase